MQGLLARHVTQAKTVQFILKTIVLIFKWATDAIETYIYIVGRIACPSKMCSSYWIIQCVVVSMSPIK